MKKIDIIDSSSDWFCCGSLCPKQEVQNRIDRMQRVIDQSHQLLNYGDVPSYIIEELKAELSLLST